MDGPAALLLRPLRLELAPHFVAPWEARSVAAFWGECFSLVLEASLLALLPEGAALCGALGDALCCGLLGRALPSAPIPVDVCAGRCMQALGGCCRSGVLAPRRGALGGRTSRAAAGAAAAPAGPLEARGRQVVGVMYKG